MTNTKNVFIGFGAVCGVSVACYWAYRNFCPVSRSKVEIMGPELRRSNVHFGNIEDVKRKLQRFVRDGKHQLQVIADFDRTLSKFEENGVLVPTCHGVMEHSDKLPESFGTEAKRVTEKYYPYECDPELTEAEKTVYMVEWWTKAHELLVRYNLHRDTFESIVEGAHIIMRDGIEHFLQVLNRSDVPLLIFSAGIGDIIELVISGIGPMYKNVKIVSNYMDFNHQGILVGFKGDVIHTFNKNENVIHQSDYFEKLQHRHNILLMGDTTGDVRMAEGVGDGSCVLKIGFLNDKVEENLDLFKKVYDIVIVKDESLDIANAILKQVL